MHQNPRPASAHSHATVRSVQQATSVVPAGASLTPGFTTRPDTLFGATFMVVAPDSDLAAELVADASAAVKEQFAHYLEATQRITEIDRQDAGRTKTGVFLDRYGINPVNG